MELKEALKIQDRMCEAHPGGCGGCPLCGDNCLPTQIDDVDSLERILVKWNKEHPEPRYPTWQEWQDKEFPEAIHELTLCNFNATRPCPGDCDVCHNQPIPEDIAKKLGIKPIGVNKIRVIYRQK